MLKRIILITILFFTLGSITDARERFFEVQSVDTMKYSRDVAREMLKKPEFDREIDFQTKTIAEMGATHIAIATPYDEEFLPFLKRWVNTARKYKLHVWFRGNWAGWEQWFGYPKITREEHLNKTKNFILSNPDLFANGDIFTSCPECENGGPGDPRITRDIEGFRNFLILEYRATQDMFKTIGRLVNTGYFSMNGDVTRLIMDKKTTEALGGIVTTDHYVRTPEQVSDDAVQMGNQSKGKVVFGEFGAPIPDIHGNMTEEEQATWVDKALRLFIEKGKVTGVNYWTFKGGSTTIVNNRNEPKKVAEILKKYFKPKNLSGAVRDRAGNLLDDVKVVGKNRSTKTANGLFILAVLPGENVTFSKSGYIGSAFRINSSSQDQIKDIVLIAHNESIIDKIIAFLKRFLPF